MANAKMFGEDYFRVAKAESGIDFFNCDTKLFPDPIAATVGFNLAIGEFHRGKKLSALNAIRAILHSPNIPNSLMCEASLLEINILLDLRQNIALLNAVKTLQAKPCWVAASPKQKETAEKLVIRARIAASTDKFALTQVQQERSTLGWLICRAEVDARNDDVASCVSRLLTARAAATSDDRALIDNTLGCLYAAVLKKANFSEAFFRSAMKATKPSEDAFGEYGSVPRSVLVYNLALSLMAQSQFREAFRLLVLTMPYYQHLPRYWLRLAECCICELEENEEPDESDDSLIHSAVKGVVLQTRFRKAITAVYPDPARHAYHLEENSKEFFNDLRNGAIPKLTYENALACLRNAQTLSGDDRTFVYLLSSTHALTAFVNLKLRRPCIALRAATQLLNLPQSARNPQIYVRGVLLKTEALVSLGNVPEALKMLDQIAAAGQSLPSQIPGLTTVAYNRALIYGMTGAIGAALEVFEQAKNLTCSEAETSNFVDLDNYLHSLLARAPDCLAPVPNMYPEA